MALQVTNSLTRTKEPFEPLTPGEVRMYVCGPTVYNFIHIGNARPLVFFDVVRRFLEKSYKVTYVMNYTDVDDKIIKRAQEEKRPWTEVVGQYIKEYETDMKLLGVKTPHKMPRVSDHIPQIIALIERLINNGVAYVTPEGEVLYSVRKFDSYGKLSGKNLDDLMAGARVEVDTKKKDPFDFSLWKPQKEGEAPAWDSPWGKGRPGWHIECSVMAMCYLGETFDLHGGGVDLIHPHHENEIAQSEGATGQPFAKYWMHNNFLNINAEKMSKSLGNFVLTRKFIEQHSAEVLKYLLISSHYRSMIDFSDQHIKDVFATLHRFYSTLKKCTVAAALQPEIWGPDTKEDTYALDLGAKFTRSWNEAMEDDFNTARVMAVVFDYVRALNAVLDRKGVRPSAAGLKACGQFLENLKELSSVLNIFGENPETFLEDLKKRILAERNIDEKDIDKLVADRIAARKEKDFKKADEIRTQLLKQGIEVRDTGEKSEWDVTFS